MAAGQGFKTFTTGEVLSAADVNGYLMQGVLVFANSAERDSEITSPQEGQFAYLKDTNVTTYYTGSAWANLDTTGMTNPMTTTGDTIYSSSGSTPARLGIGTSGQVLAVSGGVPAWTTVSSGSMTAVASGTLSGSAVAITGIPSTYKHLQLVITNYRPATDNQSLRLRVNNDSTAATYMQDWASANSAFGSSLWNIASDVDNGASQGIIVVDLYAYNDATWKLGFVRSINNNATTSTSGSYYMSFLYYNNTTTISQLNLFNSGGGNFTSGNYVVYGVN